MSDIGNIIPQLSSSIPLPGAGIFYSEAFVVGQYNSLSITIKANQNSSLLVQWSADGYNWDTSDTYTYEDGVGKYNSIVSVNKWVQLVLTNLGAGAMTYLRMNTYGVTTNNSVEAILVPESGGKISNINISNLPKSLEGLLSTTFTPIKTYNLRGMTTGSVNTYATSDVNMVASCYDNTITVVNQVYNGVGLTLPIYLVGDYMMFRDIHTTRITSGIVTSFQWCSNMLPIIGKLLSVGYGRSDNGSAIVDGFFVTSDPILGAGITYYAQSIPTFIPQSSWNIDTFSGQSNQPSKSLLDLTEVTRFKVDICRDSYVLFSILDSDGQYRPANIINLTSPSEAFLDPSLGLLGYIESTILGNLSAVNITIYDAIILTSEMSNRGVYSASVNSTKSIASLGLGYVILRNNLSSATLDPESSLVKINNLSLTSPGAGSAVFTVQLVLDATISGAFYSPLPSSGTSTVRVATSAALVTANNRSLIVYAGLMVSGESVNLSFDNIWVRSGQTLSLVIVFDSGTPDPSTVLTNLSWTEYK